MAKYPLTFRLNYIIDATYYFDDRSIRVDVNDEVVLWTDLDELKQLVSEIENAINKGE